MIKKLLFLVIIFVSQYIIANKFENSTLKINHFKESEGLNKKTSSNNLIGASAKTYFLAAAIAVTPVLSNFRVENSNKNRVYFDSSERITASTTNGFVISGKTITSITINGTSTTGHYFTVSTPFNWWSNNTIRYEGGSNFIDSDNNLVHEFSLTYIENKIAEPSATTYRYVTTSATGNGDGTNEANAWTFSQALSNASSGMTIWVKAGNYGNIVGSSISKSGTASSPIKFIGYKNVIGDINSNYWDYTTSSFGDYKSTWSSSEMPTFTGTDKNSGTMLSFYGCHYIIMRNFQSRETLNGFYLKTSTISDNIVFDRINMYLHGSDDNISSGNNNGQGIASHHEKPGGNGSSDYQGAKNVRVLDSRFINISMISVQLGGDGFSLLDGVKSYSDRAETSGSDARTDYHLAISGHNGIIRNCYAENYNDTSTNGSTHGIGIRGGNRWDNDYNLIENSTSINSKECFYIRNYGCDNNVIKNCTAYGRNNQTSWDGGFSIWGGSNYNTIENCLAYDLEWGLYYYDNAEDGHNSDKFGNNNIIKNSIFIGGSNSRAAITFQNDGDTSNATCNDDQVINCTFYNYPALWSIDYDGVVSNYKIINSNIINVQKEIRTLNAGSLTKSYSSSNFYSSWGVPSGNGNVNIDPQFVNPASRDFTPLNKSIIVGETLNEVRFDYNGMERSGNNTIGAIEHPDNTTSSINPNAGPDVDHCRDEETTLTATGNGTYLWSTGETSASIIVNPDVTTTFTVTVTDEEGNSESDDVIVTVVESPTVNAGLDVTICYGEVITLNAEGNGNFLWSTGETASSISVSPSETTTYSVTSSNFCTTTATDSVIVNVIPEINLNAGNDVTICVGENTTLTASGNGDFLWNTGETTSSIIVNPTTTTTYSVTSSSGSCSETDEVEVIVDSAPSVSLGNDVTICSGESIILTASGNGNFLWSTGETTSSISVNPLITTTYSVTASNSCDASATDDIKVNVTPEITLNAGEDVVLCSEGENITLTAVSNGDFLWSTGESTPTITVTPAETTTYYVTSTLNGCSKSDEVKVSVNEAATVDAGPDVSICFGENITLTANGSGNFLWSTGENTASITVNPTTTTTYSISSSSICGSEASDQLVVEVNEKPSILISEDVIIVKGSNTTLTAVGTGSFLWSTGESTPNITVSPNTTTTYTVTLTSEKGCSVQGNIKVTVENAEIATVTADAGPDEDVCKDSSITLTASGGDSYLWNTGEITASIIVSPLETTTYTVTVSNGTSIDVDEVIVYVLEDCSAISNRSIDQEIKVYPNPTNGLLHIELSGYNTDLNISLYTLRGRIVYSEDINDYAPDKILKRQINLARFGKGVYFVRLNNNGDSETKKVLVI